MEPAKLIPDIFAFMLFFIVAEELFDHFSGHNWPRLTVPARNILRAFTRVSTFLSGVFINIISEQTGEDIVYWLTIVFLAITGLSLIFLIIEVRRYIFKAYAFLSALIPFWLRFSTALLIAFGSGIAVYAGIIGSSQPPNLPIEVTDVLDVTSTPTPNPIPTNTPIPPTPTPEPIGVEGVIVLASSNSDWRSVISPIVFCYGGDLPVSSSFPPSESGIQIEGILQDRPGFKAIGLYDEQPNPNHWLILEISAEDLLSVLILEPTPVPSGSSQRCQILLRQEVFHPTSAASVSTLPTMTCAHPQSCPPY